MSSESKETGELPAAGAAPRIEKEITSVVAARPAKNKAFLFVFLGILAVLVYFVVAGKDEKKDQKAARFESAAGVQGVPADLQEKIEKMNALAKGLQGPGSAPRAGERSIENAAEALEEARRHAPAVVYNQRANAGGKNGSGAAPATMAAGSGANSSTTAGVPGAGTMMPAAGVAYSNAPSASATIMGNRDFIVGQGKLIDGVLETALNSDQPGMVRALVNVDIYGDSGRAVLLPRGTRIVGRYDAGIVKGQTRVFIVWQRVMRPDGVDLAIESPGADSLGRAGMAGDVDNHFWQMFGSATLLSVIGTATATAGVRPAQDQNNSIASYRQGTAESFNRGAGSVLDRYIDIKPTITVDQGSLIKIFVSKDLIFDPSLQRGSVPQVIR
jgi:type IV secretion system protein VirB10